MLYYTAQDMDRLVEKIQNGIGTDTSRQDLLKTLNECKEVMIKALREEYCVSASDKDTAILNLSIKNRRLEERIEKLEKDIRSINTYKEIKKKYSSDEFRPMRKFEESYNEFKDSSQY